MYSWNDRNKDNCKYYSAEKCLYWDEPEDCHHCHHYEIDKTKYDHEGYAILYDVTQPNGVTILKDAFKNYDGRIIPIVFNMYHEGERSHIPNTDPQNMLGNALLENREDGVYAYCKFYDTEIGTAIKNDPNRFIKKLTVFATGIVHERKMASGKIMAIKVISM